MIDWSDPLLWFLFMQGLIWGSFANVVIIRLPMGESVAFPGSRCLSTGKAIPWYDNIPVLSWFLLRGRSRFDGSRISFRYPFVELLMGIGFAYCYVVFGLSWSLLEAVIFFFGLVTVTFIDFDHYILPDVFTLSGVVIGLIGAIINPDRLFADALLGALFGGGFLYFVAWMYLRLRGEEGMGGGDIKLLGWAGAVLGWQAIAFVLIYSSFLGLFGAVFYAIKTGKGMKTVLPFGPFIAIAILIYLFNHWPHADEMVLPLFAF